MQGDLGADVLSWVTRCPSCATVFRVAEDQLRVSEGFVRCGRCDAVFNAREHLFDLESGAPAQAQAAAPTHKAPSPVADEPELERDTEAGFPSDAAEAEAASDPHRFESMEGLDSHAGPAMEPRRQEPVFEPSAPPAAATDFRATDPEPSAQRMRELLGLTPGPRVAAEPDRLEALQPSAPVASFASLDRPATSSIRSAWGWGLAGLLCLTLPLQWAWLERDALRAGWPALEALWQQACGGCEPIALARLDGLSVASSSLQPTPQGQAYHLKVRIENRAAHAVKLPWLDLQLSDANGQALLRRSLNPGELAAASVPRIEAGASIDLQATFQLEGRLAGYEIGLFYP